MSAPGRRPFDFFADGTPVPTRLREIEAEQLAADFLHAHITVESLGSQQDQNFLVRRDDAVVAVLKVTDASVSPAELEAQDAAARHVAAACPDLRVAQPMVAGDGRTQWPTAAGTARMHTYLPGGTLPADREFPARLVASVGDVAGRVSAALADLTADGLDRVIQWDPQHADRLMRALASDLEPARAEEVLAATNAAWARVSAVSGELSRQPAHLDLTESNLVLADRGPLPVFDGVIDFGDLSETWAVADAASTLTSVLQHPRARPTDVLEAACAFHARRPLSEAEASALWPLVVLRAGGLVASACHQLRLDPGNDYAAAGLVGEWLMFDAATSLPLPVMTDVVRRALGFAAVERVAPVFAVPMLDDTARRRPVELDLSTRSHTMDRGAWLAGPDAADRLASEAVAAGADLVTVPSGRVRLDRARPLTDHAVPTVPTGTDVWLAAPASVHAPFDATLTLDADHTLRLTGPAHTVRIDGWAVRRAEPGPVAAGTPVADLPGGGWTRVTVGANGVDVPAFVTADTAPGWATVTADARPLLGLSCQPDTADDATADAVLVERAEHLAGVQGHYYRRPPRIERGWLHHLMDDDGRVYLDMVNNVAVLGHAHPAMTDAVLGQLELLNTNSRFNYEVIARFCRELAATCPDGLDQVFLVNSGSEATDLALRIALATTGRHDLIAMGEAYHGWTYLSDAVSTSVADNPDAPGSRPDWLHVLDAANSYRGTHRGAEAHRYAPEAVAAIDGWAAAGRLPAAVIAETVYGNAGGMALPDGYLQQVYAAVRRHGGLAIADEVQVGYGRLGHHFWGFEQQDVVPDIVAVAKAMGDGHPLGAVITTRELAEAYRNQGYFFSSAGGSPVSCVVGSTVLRVIAEDELQANAAEVGDRLKRDLLRLADKHEIIGTVHGSGLYLGVELVRDRVSLEPATAEAYAICERLLDRGVVVQPTGDRNCILKIKPPLVLDPAAARFAVEALDAVLTEGY